MRLRIVNCMRPQAVLTGIGGRANCCGDIHQGRARLPRSKQGAQTHHIGALRDSPAPRRRRPVHSALALGATSDEWRHDDGEAMDGGGGSARPGGRCSGRPGGGGARGRGAVGGAVRPVPVRFVVLLRGDVRQDPHVHPVLLQLRRDPVGVERVVRHYRRRRGRGHAVRLGPALPGALGDRGLHLVDHRVAARVLGRPGGHGLERGFLPGHPRALGPHRQRGRDHPPLQAQAHLLPRVLRRVDHRRERAVGQPVRLRPPGRGRPVGAFRVRGAVHPGTGRLLHPRAHGRHGRADDPLRRR